MKRITSLFVFISLTVSLVGDDVFLAIISLTLEQRGAGIGLATFFLARLVPAAIVGPALGGLADRFETSRVLSVALAVQCITVFALLLNQSIWAFILASVILGLSASVSEPAIVALLPKFSERLGVAQEKLDPIYEFFLSSGYLIGPAIGGLLFDVASISEGLTLNAMTFLVAALAVLVAGVRRQSNDSEKRQSILTQIRAGSAPLFRDPVLKSIIPMLLVIFVCLFLVPIPFLFLTRDVVGVSGTMYGVFLGAWAAGSAVASSLFTFTKLDKPLQLVLLGSTGMGLSLLVTGLMPTIVVILIAQFFGGIANAAQNIGVRLLIRKRTPEESHAQTFSSFYSLSKVAIALGYLASGLAATRIPITIFIVAGLAALAVTALAIYDTVISSRTRESV